MKSWTFPPHSLAKGERVGNGRRRKGELKREADSSGSEERTDPYFSTTFLSLLFRRCRRRDSREERVRNVEVSDQFRSPNEFCRDGVQNAKRIGSATLYSDRLSITPQFNWFDIYITPLSGKIEASKKERVKPLRK